MEMNQMKRKVLSLAMIAALCLTMLPTAGWAANDPVAYIDFDENGVQIEDPGSCTDYTEITKDTSTTWNTGWYVVSGEVTIGFRVTVSGDVHLILANDAKLTVSGGIGVNENNSLTVYAQPTTENGETPGSLTVNNVQTVDAGIGGDYYQSGGTITINGGTITTNGGANSAGIGGGASGSGGTITINGGAIDATGDTGGAGIGGGLNGSGGVITINGGSVTATGGTNGAGIGGGYSGEDGGTITINGGEIKAKGGTDGAGIGGGNVGAGGVIEINSGKITATGNDGGAGIGDGSMASGSTITINGGEITANVVGEGSYFPGPGIGNGTNAAATGATTVIRILGGTVSATGEDCESYGSAGIGSGINARGCEIVISGGTVTATGGKGADGIGNDSQEKSSATFSTGEAGNAVIYATAGEGGEAIVGLNSSTGWNAIVFVKGENGSEANSGTVYGDVSLANDLTIKDKQSLEIPDGTSLKIPENVTLEIESGGMLTIDGELVVYGELKGYSGSNVHQAAEEWTNNETKHWHACAFSGCSTHQFDKAEHDLENGTCSICGYVQPVSITTQPEAQTVTEGQSAAFSVAATGGGTLSFQWLQSTDNGSNWTNIDGATQVTYTIENTTLAMSGTKYQCVVSNESGSVTSTAVTLTVKEKEGPEDPGTDPDEPSTDPDDPSTEPDDPAVDDPSDNPSTPVTPSEPDPEIEVTEPAHGDVEISPSRPEAGETVTITPTPDAGYEVENVIVTDEDGERVPVTENPDGSWSYEQPESDVTIEVIFGEIAPEPTTDVSEIFLDVDPDAWYRDAVQFAYDNGLMTGTSATEFAPDVTTTRAMIVGILARLEGVTSASDAGFSDVDDEWFATAVNWAASVGVVNGFEDNTFRPNDAITREQLAAILCNYAAWKGEDVSARADLSAYSDAAAISSWATDVMRWAVAENLISGVTTDELQPQGAATRAQVAAILQRFLSE